MTAFVPVLEHNARLSRSAWRGLLASFATPLLFLASLGWGLGTSIDRHTGTIDGMSYTSFVAPGVLVAGAMQTAAFAGAFPIMGRILIRRTYDAMLTTPIGVDHIVAAELVTTAARIMVVSAAFFGTMIAFHAVDSPLGALAIPIAGLTGVAFMAPVMALSGVIRESTPYHLLFRLVITPLFIISGAFFPVALLPDAVEVVVRASPVYHGIALARDLTTGHAGAGAAAGHALVIALFAAVGIQLARLSFRRRLLR